MKLKMRLSVLNEIVGHVGLYVMCVLLAIALNTLSAHAADKVFKLKAESVYGSMSTTTTVGLYKYLDLVEKKSNGRITFQRFADSSLVKAKEALDAIEIGMFDVLLSYPSYYSGHVPGGDIFLTPLMFKSQKDVYDVYYNTEVGSLLHQAYKEKGSILVGLQFMAANVLVTRSKRDSLAALKGLKIRGPGGMGNKMLIALDASPTMLIGPEIYTALQRGTVDGYIYPLYSTWDYKFYEQAKYIIQPDLGSIITYIWVGKKTFDSLPADLQQIMMDAGKEHASYTLAWAQDVNAKNWADLKGVGCQRVDLPKADVDQLVKTMQTSVWPSFRVNEFCKKVQDIVLKHQGWE